MYLLENQSVEYINDIYLKGFIVSEVNLRTKPLGKIIADVTIAVNNKYGRSNYLPCITWGDNAMLISHYKIGTEIMAVGRVQSRQYQKKHEDGSTESKKAYEVSISKLKKV